MWYWWVFRLSNCKCRKRLEDKLIEECIENIDEIKITSKNEHENKCGSCIVYIVLFSIFFTISIGIGVYFVYSRWCLKKDILHVKFNTNAQTTIYWTYKWEKSKN